MVTKSGIFQRLMEYPSVERRLSDSVPTSSSIFATSTARLLWRRGWMELYRLVVYATMRPVGLLSSFLINFVIPYDGRVRPQSEP